MYFKDGTFHIDFADEFAGEIFEASGLKEYLDGYFMRCFGLDTIIIFGRCEKMNAPERLENVEKLLLMTAGEKQGRKKAAEKQEKETPVKQKKEKNSATIHGSRVSGDTLSIKQIDDNTGVCVVCGNVLSINSFDIRNETARQKINNRVQRNRQYFDDNLQGVRRPRKMRGR